MACSVMHFNANCSIMQRERRASQMFIKFLQLLDIFGHRRNAMPVKCFFVRWLDVCSLSCTYLLVWLFAMTIATTAITTAITTTATTCRIRTYFLSQPSEATWAVKVGIVDRALLVVVAVIVAVVVGGGVVAVVVVVTSLLGHLCTFQLSLKRQWHHIISIMNGSADNSSNRDKSISGNIENYSCKRINTISTIRCSQLHCRFVSPIKHHQSSKYEEDV